MEQQSLIADKASVPALLVYEYHQNTSMAAPHLMQGPQVPHQTRNVAAGWSLQHSINMGIVKHCQAAQYALVLFA